MSNLTVSQKVLRDHPPEPLAGHAVVVFERLRDGGEIFREVLGPKDRVSRGLLASLVTRSDRFFGFAVTLAPILRYGFSEHVALDDHLHEVDVTFDLTYRVSNPQILATMRSRDPLGCVVSEIAALVGREIAKRPWDAIRHQFREEEAAIWASVEPRLKEHGASFGLEVRDIALRVRVRDVDLEVEVGRAQTERARARREEEHQLKLDDVEREHELREHDLRLRNQRAELEGQQQLVELMRRQREAVVRALETALDKVAGNTSTAAELREAISLALEATGGARSSSGGAPGAAFLRAASPTAGLLPPSDAGASRMVYEAMAEIEPLPCSFQQRKALQSAVLRLFASLLDEDASEASLAVDADRLKHLVAALYPQPSATQVRFLMSLTRYDELRLRLS